MRPLLAALALLLLAGCADPFGGGGKVRPVLVNRTATPLLYVAFDLADGPLIDPNPVIDPADAPEQVVQAGTQRPIAVSGDSGQGVLLFLYEFPSAEHAGIVPLSRTVTVSAGELVRSHARIVIDEE